MKHHFKLVSKRTARQCFMILSILCMLSYTRCFADGPDNDNCQNASLINISNNGFGLGKFNSSKADITDATVQPGENFIPLMISSTLNRKSVWYRFKLNTSRQVRVSLLQEGAIITAGDVGFTIYKTGNCFPIEKDVSLKLTPVQRFASTYHPCVEPGEYLIQVSAKSVATGTIFIELELGSSGALYDHADSAYQFGKIVAPTTHVDYNIGCHSIDAATETCSSLANASQYNKTTWHTFTTPAYFDYLGVLLASPTGGFTEGRSTFGYALYKGDAVHEPLSSLSAVTTCDSFVTNGFTADYIVYKCSELLPNTTYTIQLFSHQNFSSDIRLAIAIGGTAPTQAPQPLLSQLGAGNALGSLVQGTKNASDYLACNGRHSLHPCLPSLPGNGIPYRNQNFDLSTFFSFTLDKSADINISASAAPCNYAGLMIRVFPQPLSDDCTTLDTANTTWGLGNVGLDCLTPGKYVVQVSGTDVPATPGQFNYSSIGGNSTLCLLSNLGSRVGLAINVVNKTAFSHYSLNEPNAFDAINFSGSIMQALQYGITYASKPDTFGCKNTVLPDGGVCLNGASKIMYREFAVSDSGVAAFGSYTYPLAYRLFKGDANALASAQNVNAYPQVIKGLVPMTPCIDAITECKGDMVCITPGTYTLATFGNDGHIGYKDAPTIKFDLITTKHRDPSTAQDLGNIIDTARKKGNFNISTDNDVFSCIDNALHVNGYQPCNIGSKPATKAIYRQFYLSEPALMTIRNFDRSCNNPYGGVMTLFYGKISDGADALKPVSRDWSCFQNQNESNECTPMAAGWYTLISYGSGPSFEKPLQSIYEKTFAGYVGTSDSAVITVKLLSNKVINRYSLNKPGAFDTINTSGGVMQPLKDGATYVSRVDTFSCQNTVLPDTVLCQTSAQPITKVMYREFVVADSGMAAFYNYRLSSYRLYKGDANALATAQGKNAFPDVIKGLSAYTLCIPYNQNCGGDRVCVIPGTYTFAGFGTAASAGITDAPRINFDIISTKHFNAANAQNLGNIIDTLAKKGGTSVISDTDIFSCRDNAETINGFVPCPIGNRPATKAIYRQFYLSDESIVSITNYSNYSCGYTFGGVMALFTGKATDGLGGLKPVGAPWSCFYSQGVNDRCKPMPAGWYTLVSYGSGPTFENPTQNVSDRGYGSSIGLEDRVTITVTKACAGPKFNRPFKASVDTATKKPYVLEWNPRKGHTNAYPKTDTTYTLAAEYFNCTIDTPFSTHPIKTCAANLNRVAYYVFEITKVSYLQIDTKGYWAQVFALDVRKDSALFATATPIQPCLSNSGWIQLCSVQPGLYTLVLFAGDVNSCANVTPSVYIDQVGYSRFDHAKNAYDFGVVPANVGYQFGKTGDVNPLDTARKPSNDFFYCTTGSQKNDPSDAVCESKYTPSVYNSGVNNALYNTTTSPVDNNAARRDLWYTFVINKPGTVRVRVYNKTIGKTNIYPFTVYRSNVDGTLPFTSIVNAGLVDSTIAQGLSLVKTNMYARCYGTEEVSFYRDPCTTTVDRYYIVVENHAWMNPSSQVEISVLIDSATATPTKFDHYSKAWDFGKLIAGKYAGDTDNYSCASPDLTDPVFNYKSCAVKTIWYKFTSSVTGHIRYRTRVNGVVQISNQSVQLFSQQIPGDSTVKGLTYEPASAYYDNATGSYWAQECISPGTYYLLLTGCGQNNEFVYPEIQITDEAGDFCSAPVVVDLKKPGAATASVIVDCHTIGTDYGEFNEFLSCPPNGKTSRYKSSWFRLDIGGTDTLDVTAFLDEKTTVNPENIQYRLMTGNCGAMQEQSCVQDALTRNTYKCLAPGSYFIQVFTPVLNTNNTNVTGTIDLHLSSVIHVDSCAPVKRCLVTAAFVTAPFDCKTESKVRFINYSTYGSSIITKWDFGYNGQTSTEVSPSFLYPAWPRDTVYTVTLVIENKDCNEKDTATLRVPVPARPYADLGKDISLCVAGSSVTLDVTSFPGATYLWQNGSTAPTYRVTAVNQNRYNVRVTYKGCISYDTINVFINPITKKSIQKSIICDGDSIKLSGYRGSGETYLWSNKKTSSEIYVSEAGLYWVDIIYNGCIVRDTFQIEGKGSFSPLGADTVLCSLAKPITINATISGVTKYTWQDGKQTPSYLIDKPGIYWVDMSFGTCVFRDSLKVSLIVPVTRTRDFTICQGSGYTLPSGIIIKNEGVYKDTIRTREGCDSLITSLTLHITLPNVNSKDVNICNGSAYTLPWGPTVSASGVYADTLKSIAGCDSIISKIVLKNLPVTDTFYTAYICSGEQYRLPWGVAVNDTGTYQKRWSHVVGCDSLIITIHLLTVQKSSEDVYRYICQGEKYTLPSGEIVQTPGTYASGLRNFRGCDSIIVTHLSLKKDTLISISVSICQGTSYKLPSGIFASRAGIYRDTLRYAAGCDSVIRSTTITVINPISATLEGSVCQGKSYMLPSGKKVTGSGIFADTLKGVLGCDSIYYQVSLTAKTFTTSVINKTICGDSLYILPSGRSVSKSGTYPDTLRGSSGCDSVIFTAIITFISKSDMAITASKTVVCEGDSLQLNVKGGQAVWVPDNTLHTGIAGSAWVYPVKNITYSALISNQGCQTVDTVSLKITVNPRPILVVSKSNDVTCLNSTTHLTAKGASTYKWTPDSTLKFPTSSTTIALPSVATTYYVTGTSSKGCVSTDSVKVSVVKIPSDKDYQVANAFSPNGDGNNDCFGISSWGKVTNLQFAVYNRWGEIVFKTTDPTACWDGTFRGVPQATGNFPYIITATTICGDVKRMGSVILVR